MALVLAGIALAIYMLMRRAAADRESQREEARELKREHDVRLAALNELIVTARRESERLEAAIQNAEAIELAAPLDTLTALESLADPSSLADPDALGQVAARLPQLPSDVAGDVFDSDRATLEMVRLLDRGHSADEIARRLHLPIGEVELRLSLRSE